MVTLHMTMMMLTLLLAMTLNDVPGVKVEGNRISIKRTVDPREAAKAFLQQAFPGENIDDLVRATSKHRHFEKHFPSGAFVTMDDEEGWLVIFAGYSDGPRLGLALTSYKIKVD
jgi:hypothetical protein